MFVAKEFAKAACHVELLCTQYDEDIDVLPSFFTNLGSLHRSVLDVNPQLKIRKLPLIYDILNKAYQNSTADYIIYTNVDIGLQPYFYEFVAQKIAEGHDALVINRRRLKPTYNKIEELPLIYADLGKSHPGFDCFVFHRSLFEKFILGDISVGISFIGVALAHNIFSLAQKPLYVPDALLTFHIGMDVLVPRSNAFYFHNKKEFFTKVYPQLVPHFSLHKFPYAALPIHKRALKWILNPSLFTKNYLNLQGKSIFYKVKTTVDEIRWRILQK
jgi:hypothetical protein